LDELVKLAAERAREAVKLDRAGRYKLAAARYLEAADLLLKLVRLTEEPELRAVYLKRAKEYIARSRQLQQAASAAAKPRSEASTGLGVEELKSALESTVLVERPDVKWDDVVGLEHAKELLREAVELPLLRPDLFKGARRPWKGILLFGPPGCGKTMLAKAVASLCRATFLNVSAADVMSKWLGESERLVKALFALARERRPSIIFIDEVDSLMRARSSDETGAERRVKAQLLAEWDGLASGEGVVVIGATNRPWDIDPGFLRRFERRIYVPPPDYQARLALFKVHTRGVELDSDVDFAKLAQMTEGFTGHDIARLCREALMEPIRELERAGRLRDPSAKVRPVSMQDFTKALNAIKPSVPLDELSRFERWAQEHGERA